jgi:hypothetical protein
MPRPNYAYRVAHAQREADRAKYRRQLEKRVMRARNRRDAGLDDLAFGMLVIVGSVVGILWMLSAFLPKGA